MSQAATPPREDGRAGFTLIELVTVLVILGIVMVVLSTRGMTLRADLANRQSEIRAQMRYLQLRAMKEGVSTYMGLKCDGTNYWAFSGTTPTVPTTYLILPGESSKTVSLSGKSMTMTAFTISFDSYGIPYTGDAQTKLASSASITITAGGASGALTVAPETGFVP